MGRYEAIHNETDMVKTYMLFADREDTTFTVTADHIIGYDNIKSYFERMTGQMGGAGKRKGTMFEHPLSTPIIEVAADGKTAKATWASFGEETMGAMGGPPPGSAPAGAPGDAPGSVLPGGPPGGAPGSDSSENLVGMWCYGKYANDFIKVNGEWKIWHLQWIRFFRTPFDTSWVDQPIEEIYGQFYQNGKIIEKEGLYFKPYYTGKVSESIPAAPKPYETWTKEEEDWWLRDTIDP